MVKKNDIEYVTRILQHYRYENQLNSYEIDMVIQYLEGILQEEFENEESWS